MFAFTVFVILTCMIINLISKISYNDDNNKVDENVNVSLPTVAYSEEPLSLDVIIFYRANEH